MIKWFVVWNCLASSLAPWGVADWNEHPLGCWLPSGHNSPTDEATGQSVEVTAANRKQLGLAFRTVVRIQQSLLKIEHNQFPDA